jgi:hypothetical protein
MTNIGIAYLNQKLVANDNKAETDKSLERRGEVDSKVQYLIDEALINTGARRVTIMEFHNKSANLAHLPFCFMSCTYETYKEGLPPIAQSLQNISASLYSIFLTSLQISPYLVLDADNRDPAKARMAYELLTFQNEKKALCVVFRNPKKQAIGYVTLKKNEDFKDEDVFIMRDLAQQMGSLLAQG